MTMPLKSTKEIRLGAAITICLAVGGCGQPKQVEVTVFDVDAVTTAAMQQLDQDQNEKLSAAELKASPGLRGSRREIDSNRDGQISKEELHSRLQTYVDQRIAILPYPIYVTLRGRPLVGATVVLTPESFLGEVIEPATGETDSYGVVRPTIELDDEIASRGTTGFRSGVYRVSVSQKDAAGNEKLPARFNTESKLGIEVSMREHMSPLKLDL